MVEITLQAVDAELNSLAEILKYERLKILELAKATDLSPEAKLLVKNSYINKLRKKLKEMKFYDEQT
jgi:hypothetical protein